MAAANTHSYSLRTYYEDTDAGGVVYHASYLRFMERARTEALRLAGYDHAGLLGLDPPILLVVRHAALDYAQPARLDEELTIVTAVEHVGGASFRLRQRVMRDGTLLCDGLITIVAVSGGKPARLPEAMRATFRSWLAAG
jgi:acyl-CoA thioester hydrolase